jgi:hypothetical protein
MKLDRLTATDFQLDVEAEELAALIAAARCALEPGCTGLNEATAGLVSRLLQEYDVQATSVRTPYPGARPAPLRLTPPVDDNYGQVQYDPF